MWPSLAHDGQRLAFEDAEVGGVAQIVALPGVAVDQQGVEPGFAHRVGETLDPLPRDHGSLRLGDDACGDIVRLGLGRALARIAIAAAAGGEEGHAVACRDLHLGRLLHRPLSLPSAR